MYQESFPSRLKKARQRTGFTQREVQTETGLSQSVIASYETGRTQPDIENLGTLADFYGVSIDWLVGTVARNTAPQTATISETQDKRAERRREKRKLQFQDNYGNVTAVFGNEVNQYAPTKDKEKQ